MVQDYGARPLVEAITKARSPKVDSSTFAARSPLRATVAPLSTCPRSAAITTPSRCRRSSGMRHLFLEARCNLHDAMNLRH
jgi:hypothetical protein